VPLRTAAAPAQRPRATAEPALRASLAELASQPKRALGEERRRGLEASFTERARGVPCAPARPTGYPLFRFRMMDMLRPLDLTVLAFLRSVLRDRPWTQMDVAAGLGVSQSSVHRALQQLEASRLLGDDDRRLRDLLVHAVAHVYPPQLGPPARGVPTSHSHPTLAGTIRSSDAIVWPHDGGDSMGVALDPLHPCVPAAALRAPAFHELMALIDALRLGRARERALATQRLDDMLELS